MNMIKSSGSDLDSPVNNPSSADVLRQFFAKNPFYIVSAGLLLYGIYRLSIDPKMFATEVAQLFFNFGSFQFYELLLVGTAIVLARRKIWYDASLLICLENLFLFLPFILISQALLIQNRIALVFCLSACALVVARFGGLKKFVTEFQLPSRLFVFGGVLLMVNLGLPLLFRFVQNQCTALTWDIYANALGKNLWLFMAPALLALINYLPHPKNSGELLFRKSYFPLLLLGIWTIGTSVHLYCVGYVYGLKWQYSLLTPLLWMGAWTLWNRINDLNFLDEEPDMVFRDFLLIPATAVNLLAMRDGNWPVVFALTGLNAVAYAFLSISHRSAFAFHLLLVSGALLVASVPTEFLVALDLNISRAKCFGAAIVAYLLIRALLSQNPKLGLLGAVATAIGAVVFLEDRHAGQIAFQLGSVFLLAHSLRWKDSEQKGAATTRILAAIIWVVQSGAWLNSNRDVATLGTEIFASALLIIYVATRFIFLKWGHWVVPAAAVLVLCFGPLLRMQLFFKEASTGLLAILSSFLLFGMGTVLALNRNRWIKNAPSTAIKAVVVSFLIFSAPQPAFSCINKAPTGTKYDGSSTRSRGLPAASMLRHYLRLNHRLEGAQMEQELRGKSDFEDRNDYAVALMYLGRNQEAVALLEKLEAEQPGKYFVAANLGTAYELSGKNVEALGWIKEGIVRNPKDHEGTEWLHARILEAKIAQEKDPDYFKKHSVLDLQPDRVVEGFVRDGKKLSPADLTKALQYQLGERLQFVKPPDAPVASLLFDYAAIEAGTRTLESAQGVLKMAAEYGYPSDRVQEVMKVYERRIQSRKAQANAFLILLLIGAIGLLAYCYKRRWFVLSSRQLETPLMGGNL